MIDFIKVAIITTLEHLLANPKLKFVSRLDETTGEVIPNRHGYFTRVAEFGQLKIKITQNNAKQYTNIELSGSLHKHHFGGANFTDYTFTDISTTINQICDLLDLTPDKFIIKHIEYGVNIQPTHCTTNVLNSIVAYKGKQYETREYNGTGYMKRFCLTQYDVKIYDKSKQYSLPVNVLRYELKVFKMQHLKSKGIQLKTFADLLQKSHYSALCADLLSSFDMLYMFDYRIHLKAIKQPRERLILTECINTTFWGNYRKQHSVKGYTKKVNRFRDLVKKYAPDNLQLYLKNEIQNKCLELLNSTQFLPSVQNTTIPSFYPLIVSNNIPLNKNYCVTCGRDITAQKTNSRFCSEKIHGPSAKKCRNVLSNLKRDEKRKYQSITLFDVDVYLLPQYLNLKKLINEKPSPPNNA